MRKKEKKMRKKKVALHRIEPGPLTLNKYRAIRLDVQPGGENNTASDVVKDLHRTKKGGFERTSSNPTGSATGNSSAKKRKTF